MKRVVIPFTKSPHAQGRIGSPESQDWCRALQKAVGLSRLHNCLILIISNFQATDSPDECAIYEQALTAMGCQETHSWDENCGGNFMLIHSGFETMGQVEEIAEIINKRQLSPIFVSTFLHYPRVRWLTKGMGGAHYIGFGIPRPSDVVSDIALWFIFPAIDLLGKREQFKEWLIRRREDGKL